MLLARYPQFAAVPVAQINAFIADAALTVPCCKLGSRADLALVYKTASLLSSGLTSGLDGSGGGVKRKKDGDVEIEYFGGGSSAGVMYANDFERLYNQLVRGIVRNSPRVLNGQ